MTIKRITTIKHRGVIAALLGASLLLGTAACGDDAESTGSGGTDKVTVNSLEILSLAPMMVADAKGFFGKHRVEVEFSNADIYSRLAVQGQGKLDVNIPGTGGALFNAVNQGLRVRAVADRQQYRCASDNLLLARTQAFDGGLKSVADLKGKKVAILAKGSTTEYWLDRALGEVGLKQSDLGQIVTLSYPDTANALKSGAVDAGFLVQPLAYQLITDGQAKRVLAMNEVAPNQEQGLITMSQDFISKRPEVAARWMAGWLEGVRYYQDPANKDDVIKIVAERTKVPAETITKLYGTDQWPYMDPNGRVDTATVVAEDGKWLLDNKIIEKLPEVGEWHDGSVVDAALKIVGEVPANRDCGSVQKLES
ncbi:ABC transporter substrate-binding protein [Micromonospora wenchangensis]|uniref:ABC transporter substrate-binding protein n=1 Tax=Micromonospora wenchangensis TaxID=1185415 RepID=UPI0033FD0101